MYPNWGNVQGSYAIYGQVDPNYQQQMLQWQQMNQMGGQQWGTFVQPAPPLPTGGEAKPPEPPADEKPPLPPEPPPEGGDTKEKDMKPMSETEKLKLTQLQQQAAQWQQQQTWTQQQMHSWGTGMQQQGGMQPQSSMPQQGGMQPQSNMQPQVGNQPGSMQQQQSSMQQQQSSMQQPMAGTTGNVQQKIDAILQEEREFNVQYQQWKKQYDEWREQNQNHPNREQFQQYEQQWMMYQKQMDDKRADIQRRKQTLMQEQGQVSPQQGQQQGQFGGPRPPAPRGGINQMPGPRGPQMNRGRPDFRPRGPQGQFRPQMNQGPRGNFNSGFQGMSQEEDYEEKGMDLDDDLEEEGNALMNQVNQVEPQGQNMGGPRAPWSMGGNNKFGGQEQQNFGRGIARGQRPPRGRGGRGNQRGGRGGGGGPVPLMSMSFKDQGGETYEGQGEGEKYDDSYERNPNNVPIGQGRGGPRFGFNRGQGDPRPRFQKNNPNQQGFNNPNQGPRFGGRGMQNQGPRFGFQGNQQNLQREGWHGAQEEGRQQAWLQKHLHGGGGGNPQHSGPGDRIKAEPEDQFDGPKDTSQGADSSEIDALRKQQDTLNELKKMEQKTAEKTSEEKNQGNNSGPSDSVSIKTEPKSPSKQSDQKGTAKPGDIPANEQREGSSSKENLGQKPGQQDPKGPSMPGPNQHGPRGPGQNQGPGPNQFSPRGPGPNQGPRGPRPQQPGPRGPGPFQQGQRPSAPGQHGQRGPSPQQQGYNNQGQNEMGPRGPNQHGPRGPGPNQQGPRGPGMNQQGPRGPNQQGPRGPGPNQQGPRGPGPNQQGPRGPGPNQQGPRGPGPNQQGPRGPGLNQHGPRGPGPTQPGFRGPSPNQQGPRGPGPNQQGPRGPGPNQQGPRGPSPNQHGSGAPGPGLNEGDQDPNEGPQQPGPNQFTDVTEESHNTGQDQEYPQEDGWQAPWGPGWRGRGRGRRPYRGRGGVGQREPYPAEQKEGPPVDDYPDRVGPPEQRPREDYGWHDRRADPYYDRRDPYYDRFDPYPRRYDPYDRPPPPPDPYDRRPPPPPDPFDRRPYPEPYSRPYDYGRDYYDAYRPPPPVEDRPFQKPEVIDHAHKSSGDFLSRAPETPYVAPQTVIDYGHGRSTEEKERPPSATDRDRDRFRDPGSYRSPSHDRNVHEPRIEVVKVEDLLILPGRRTRPPQIVVILRGLPGSGKTYVGKLVKDKEVQHGGGAPRMLCLDDYFMTEVEKTEKDPETGKKVKKKVLEYEYEPELEVSYRQNMFKSFKKTIDDGFFPFIIVDAVNEKVKHFEEFWSYAKSKGFQVYIAEIEADITACSKRNTHHRSMKDIEKIKKYWEETPRHYLRLDVRALLQEDSITEVEMEDTESNTSEKRRKTESDEEEDLKIGGVHIKKSKWEVGTEEELDKLDGLVHQKKRRPATPVSIDDFLGEYYSKPLAPGQKRVRWADVEERKEQLRRREIGFVVGQTQRDWERITDDTFADRQLNRTKYI